MPSTIPTVLESAVTEGSVMAASSAVNVYSTGSLRPRSPKATKTSTENTAIAQGAFQLTLASARENIPGFTSRLMMRSPFAKSLLSDAQE